MFYPDNFKCIRSATENVSNIVNFSIKCIFRLLIYYNVLSYGNVLNLIFSIWRSSHIVNDQYIWTEYCCDVITQRLNLSFYFSVNYKGLYFPTSLARRKTSAITGYLHAAPRESPFPSLRSVVQNGRQQWVKKDTLIHQNCVKTRCSRSNDVGNTCVGQGLLVTCSCWTRMLR